MRAVLVAILLGLAPMNTACDRGQAVSALVETPAATSFVLYTHCGPDWRTRFDGSYWDLASPVPGPLGDPYQAGEMRLGEDQQTAKFEYRVSGHAYVLTFRRHADGVALKPPIGCD